jgi:hypothetical protein
MPVATSEWNFAAAKEPKELWLVPGAKHSESDSVQRDQYEQKVVKFFASRLGLGVAQANGAVVRNPAYCGACEFEKCADWLPVFDHRTWSQLS